MSTNVTEQVTHFVNSAFHASLLTYAAIGVGMFMAAFLFRLFFQDFTDFWECVRYWLRPDILSWFKGESVEDAWSEMKLFVWVALATGSGILAYHQLPGWFPGFFGR
jgi:uncharacterized membrane protein